MSPILHIFAISHYCEKARWAMDYCGVQYQANFLSPGAHRVALQKLGLKKSSVPVLETASGAIQGSGKIIDWLESNGIDSARSLALPDDLAEQGRAIEQRLDHRIGVHLRRMFYSEALLEHPKTVKPVLSDGLSWRQRLSFSLIWPTVRKLMIKGMDLGAEQGAESQAIIAQELAWLEELLADGRRYLLGDSFSRVDLTAAALLARLAMPPEHPGEAPFIQPPRLQAQVAEWRHGQVLDWVNRIYREHR